MRITTISVNFLCGKEFLLWYLVSTDLWTYPLCLLIGSHDTHTPVAVCGFTALQCWYMKVCVSCTVVYPVRAEEDFHESTLSRCMLTFVRQGHLLNMDKNMDVCPRHRTDVESRWFQELHEKSIYCAPEFNDTRNQFLSFWSSDVSFGKAVRFTRMQLHIPR